MVAVYEEQRTAKIGRDGSEVTRTFRVEPFTQAGTVVDALLGGVRIVGGRLFRVPPSRDPWFPHCWCVDVKVDPFEVLNSPGVNIGLAQLLTANYSESARIVATYRSLDHDEKTTDGGSDDNDEKELATEDWDFSAQQLTLPNQYWKWPDGELLVRTDTSVTKTFPRIDYSLTRHYCINIPQDAINQLIGRVNKSAFLVKKKSRNPQCVRLDGAHIHHRVTNQGLQFAEIQYKFAVNKIYDYCESLSSNALDFVTWNRLFRPEKAYWERPTASGDARRLIYELDEDAPSQTIGGQVIRGFALLFHPGAH